MPWYEQGDVRIHYEEAGARRQEPPDGGALLANHACWCASAGNGRLCCAHRWEGRQVPASGGECRRAAEPVQATPLRGWVVV
jgi:hypothetical protein